LSGARLAVLASGRGSNLEAILAACAKRAIAGEVVAVLSNKPQCRALEIAREAKVPLVRAFTLGEYDGVAARDKAMADALTGAGVEVVVCAGYDRVLDEGFVHRFEGRILNVHPSLLPAFGGSMDAIARAYESGVKVTGVTVHMIEPDTVDSGSIVAQECVTVRPDDTLDSLTERVQETEHELLPRVIQWMIEGRLERAGTRVVVRQ
jgi:phosphoribosylglycinamide formyltransferase-1